MPDSRAEVGNHGPRRCAGVNCRGLRAHADLACEASWRACFQSGWLMRATDEDDGRITYGEWPYRGHTRWPWWAALVFVAAVLVAAALAAQAVMALLSAGGVIEQNWLLLVALGVSQVLTAALTVWAVGWLGDRRAKALALGPPAQGPMAYVLAFLAMLAVFGALSAAMWFHNPDRVAGDLMAYAGLVRSDAWWLAALVIVLGAPVMEEVVFRGFLFPALARGRMGVAGAAVTTTAAWTALHAGYSLMGLVEVFLVGLYFVWVLLKTGSLRVPIFCHAAYNFSALLVLLAVDISASAPA